MHALHGCREGGRGELKLSRATTRGFNSGDRLGHLIKLWRSSSVGNIGTTWSLGK